MKTKTIGSGFLIALIVWVSQAAALTPSGQLTKLLSRYTTYQATFLQTTYDSKGRHLQSSRGRVVLKRPSQFRWQTISPSKQLVIANKKTLWVYDQALKQATRHSLTKASVQNPAALLTGELKNLAEQFVITRIPGDSKGVWFQLKPRKTNRGFVLVEMQFISDKLTGMKVVNNLGQTNVFRFTQIKINPPLSSQLFRFKPPPGVDVLSQ